MPSPDHPDHVRYNFEHERRLRACFIGAGGHSFRNVYPTFRYAPIDLVAVCDTAPERAATYARLFGGERHYTDHREMLERERPDAVFIVTSYHADGRVQATDLALEALAAGAHVWSEKPIAASVAEVDSLTEASAEAGRFVMVGLKKQFFPTITKAKEIIESRAFGRASSVYLRYPQDMAPPDERGDLLRSRWLLDHIYHPGAIIHYLMGPVERLTYEWEGWNGGSVASLRFASGAVGTFHMAAGASGSSPLERLEVVGEGANVVVENGVKLTYYRKAVRPAYGRAASFMVEDETAPLVWEPEFSLGQLYNNNMFLLGYAPEVLHFAEAVLAGRPPTKGTLADCRAIMQLYEAYVRTPAGTPVAIQPTDQ